MRHQGYLFSKSKSICYNGIISPFPRPRVLGTRRNLWYDLVPALVQEPKPANPTVPAVRPGLFYHRGGPHWKDQVTLTRPRSWLASSEKMEGETSMESAEHPMHLSRTLAVAVLPP